MPTSPKLQQHEVFAAIEKLLAEAAYPTSARVRQILGGRGSPVVIQRFLANWYEENGPELAKKVKIAKANRPTTTALRGELDQLTKEAIQQIDAAQAERVSALDAREAGLNGRDEDLLTHEHRLDERETVCRDLAASMQEGIQNAHQELTKAKETIATQEATLASLQATETRLSDQINAVNHRFEETNKTLHDTKRTAATLAEEKAVLQERLAEQRKQVEKTRTLLNQAQASEREQHDAYLAAKNAQIQSKETAERSTKELAVAESEVMALRRKLEKVCKEAEKASSDNAVQQTNIDHMVATIDALRHELKEAKEHAQAESQMKQVLEDTCLATNDRMNTFLDQFGQFNQYLRKLHENGHDTD